MLIDFSVHIIGLFPSYGGDLERTSHLAPVSLGTSIPLYSSVETEFYVSTYMCTETVCPQINIKDAYDCVFVTLANHITPQMPVFKHSPALLDMSNSGPGPAPNPFLCQLA